MKIDPTVTEQQTAKVRDSFDRPLHDLRISVIDQCNFRCPYCMPEKSYAQHYTFLKQSDWLTFEEIERLARLFVQLGVRKIRLTGGEPLLRPDLPDLVRRLKNIDGVNDLALTTNGSLLAKQAEALQEAGLTRITVSLDTLNQELFRQLNGYKATLDRVLDGIKKCEETGFETIKINVVLQKDIHRQHILDLVRYFKYRKPILRFIEYMDVGNCNAWDPQAVFPASEVVKMINAYSPIVPIGPNYYGEVASRYAFADRSGEIGFIASVTQPFCRSCTRARLSADGKLYTCLFARRGIDLRTLIHHNAPDSRLLDIIQSVWQKREDRYSELRNQLSPKERTLPKIEMFQIGG
jgi:cyclic pyranopterin phosphate synthase